MTQTEVIECPNCNGLMLATASQKTKTCPYCGSRIDIAKAKKLARATTAMEASRMLRKMKAERKKNPGTPRKATR